MPIIEKQVDAQPEAVASVTPPVLLASGDQRFGLPEAAVLSQAQLRRGQGRACPGHRLGARSRSPLSATSTKMPPSPRSRRPSARFRSASSASQLAADARKASFRADRSPIVLTHDGPADKALVEAVWPTTDDSNFREVVGVELLKDVLDLMLTDSVREKLGDSYGVSLASIMSDTFAGFGYLSAGGGRRPRQDRRGPEGDRRRRRRASRQADQRRSPRPREQPRAREGGPHACATTAIGSPRCQKAQSEPAASRPHPQAARRLLQSITAADIQKLAQKYLQPATAAEGPHRQQQARDHRVALAAGQLRRGGGSPIAAASFPFPLE